MAILQDNPYDPEVTDPQTGTATPTDSWFAANPPPTQTHPPAPGSAMSLFPPTNPGATIIPSPGGGGVIPGVYNVPGNFEAFYRQYLADHPSFAAHQSAPGSLQPFVDAAKAAGYDVSLDTRTDGLHKGVMFNGQFIKLLDGSDRFIFDTAGEGGSGDDSGGDLAGFGAFLQPWTREFEHPDFVAPTDITEQNDPGFQERLKAGQQALERSAASKGTLLTGGTLKGLEQFGQDYASSEYGNVYNRAFNDWSSGYNKDAAQYVQDYNIFNANEDRPFNKLSNIAGLGQVSTNILSNQGGNYAALAANTLQNGANNQGNYLTQGANATAAGGVGAANAYANLFGSLANTGLGAYYANLYAPKK